MNDDYRYIAAIAEHGSISQAARATHISQPGLSQRLKRLETQLGTALFDRATSPLKPTEAGEVYLRYAQRALAAETTMRREVFSVVRKRRKRLCIGMSTERANAMLAQPIAAFSESQKGCTLELHEMSTFEHMHKLFVNDVIDFAALTPISPDPGAYSMEVLCHERLQVITSHEFVVPALSRARSNAILLRQLEGVPFILPTCGKYFDPLISNLIDASNTQLDIIVRDCSAELALALVKDGLGISVVPSTWVTGIDELVKFDLADMQAGNVLRYICRADHTASPEERVFMSLLREHIQGKSERAFPSDSSGARPR